jgi:hypothetical protein
MKNKHMTKTNINRKKYHRIYYRKNREFILKRAKLKALKQKYKCKFDLDNYVKKKKTELIKNNEIIIHFD